jgi:hypothetical protein
MVSGRLPIPASAAIAKVGQRLVSPAADVPADVWPVPRVPGVEDAAQVFVIVCGLRAEYGIGLVEQERGRVVADQADQRGGMFDDGPIACSSVDGALGRLRLAVA